MAANEQKVMNILEVEFDGNVLNVTVAPEDLSEAYTINLFARDYDKDKKTFVDNDETLAKFNEALKEYLEIDSVDGLEMLEGKEVTVFVNGNNATFWEVKKLLRPDVELIGVQFKGKVVGVRDYDTQRRLVLEKLEDEDTGEVLEGEYFVSFNFGQYIKSKGISIPVKSKLADKKEQFEDLTGVKWEEHEKLVGETLKVEVKENKVSTEVPTYLELKKRRLPKQ